MKHDERRAAPRLERKAETWLRIDREGDAEDATSTSIRCRMLNLSWGGLAIALPDDAGTFAADERVFVELPLGHTKSFLRTPCRVVGVAEGSVHLAFLDDSEFFRRTVEASLAGWQSD